MTRYGPQHWWPVKEPFEVIIGAILTQSTSWRNAGKAIHNLEKADVLSPKAIRRLGLSELATLIHPCGYYNAKAQKLKAFVDWLEKYHNGDLNHLFATKIDHLRQQLLSVYGIGNETADSIILYAGNKPIFVVDAYTHRIFSRIGLAPHVNGYLDYQAFFMANLPADVRLFNEYHALIVGLAKEVCRKLPLCPQCCLADICRFYTDRRNQPRRETGVGQ